MTTVLSVGTTHPWNIAGIGLDLLVGAELGVRVLTVCTAVSAQDRDGLHALETLSPDIIRAQFAATRETPIDAVRVGAMTSAAAVAAVASELRRYYDLPIVVDPVMTASRGGTFVDAATMAAFRSQLASLPNVILTPNLEEAQALLGDAREIRRDTLGEAARDLQRFGVRAVLLKGGHLQGDPADALATIDTVELLDAARLGRELRGTGCLLAMSLACRLAQGVGLRDAVQFARAFVRRKIEGAREFGGLPVAY